MDRFIRYSLEKDRKIRMVLMLDGLLRQTTASVLACDETTATLSLSGKKTPRTVSLTDILSCDYARGDHGED